MSVLSEALLQLIYEYGRVGAAISSTRYRLSPIAISKAQWVAGVGLRVHAGFVK